VSKLGWPVLFPLVRDEDKLRPHALLGGIGMAHPPTIVLLMAGHSVDCATGLKSLLYSSKLDLDSIIHFLLLRFLLLCDLQ
jgi:hypothetical protein